MTAWLSPVGSNTSMTAFAIAGAGPTPVASQRSLSNHGWLVRDTANWQEVPKPHNPPDPDPSAVAHEERPNRVRTHPDRRWNKLVAERGWNAATNFRFAPGSLRRHRSVRRKRQGVAAKRVVRAPRLSRRVRSTPLSAPNSGTTSRRGGVGTARAAARRRRSVSQGPDRCQAAPAIA